MAKRDYLKRYILIVDLLRKTSCSFDEIRNYLHNQEIEISQRTFQRDKDEIESLWGIEIQYNKKIGVYEINEDYTDEKFERIVESFNIVNALNQNNSVSKYVFLEKRQPKGTKLFHGILHAIQQGLIVTFQLNSFWNLPTQRRCVPKALKEAQNRWYLVGYDLERNDFRNYGLDRIFDFVITSSKKSVPEIDIEKHYEHAFGIETYGEPEKVVLKFSNSQKEYLKTLPLHHSQKIIAETETDFTIELYVHPTNDFVMEIFRFAEWCEVFEPFWMRKDLKEVFDNKSKIYK